MHFIADYSGESDESENENETNKRKSVIETQTNGNKSKKVKSNESCLPPPVGIQSMFNEADSNTPSDESTEHGGRIRSFAHERGNWASYVYIPVEDLCVELLRDLTQSLVDKIQSFADFRLNDDFHISLSRTFVIKHHWISPMVKELQTSLGHCKTALLQFTTLKFYTNDEKTRTFIGLCMGGNLDKLQTFTQKIDSILERYQLPKYYEKPSFHISLAWAVGDVISGLDKTKQEEIKALLDEHSEDDLDILGRLEVSNLKFKTGNKVFDLPLKAT